MNLETLVTVAGIALGVLAIALSMLTQRLKDHPRITHWCGIAAYFFGAAFVWIWVAYGLLLLGVSPALSGISVAAALILISAIFWPQIERVAGYHPETTPSSMPSPANVAVPRLVPTIKAAYDEQQEMPGHWLIFMRVRVENIDPYPVMIEDWETRLKFNGAEYIGRKFEPPQGFQWNIVLPDHSVQRFPYVHFIDKQGVIRGHRYADCTVPAAFYDLRYETFHDVILGLRAKPVGGAWSNWHEFQPPEYTVKRQRLNG